MHMRCSLPQMRLSGIDEPYKISMLYYFNSRDTLNRLLA